LMFARKTQMLFQMGVSDVILDPGFGFGKTLDDNYAIFSQLEKFHELALPLLVGISRKSMIYRLLDITPEQALNGTTALHAAALLKGADILRVHDVREAVETCRIMQKIREGCVN
ncbi:MAG: dihydropteroate synthase, partial [Prevotella sp.]|nr:dihydropteroate synthase [Prevotella sp.]